MPNPQVVVEFVSTGYQAVRGQLASLRQQAQAATGAQSGLGQSTRAAATSSTAQARQVAAADRALLQLRSTLGGSERAASQLEVATRRLNQAHRAGIIGQAEYVRLGAQVNRTFTTAAINSKDLRLNMLGLRTAMAGVNEQLALIAASRIPGGAVLLPLAGRIPAAGLAAGVGAMAAAFVALKAATSGQTQEIRAAQAANLGYDQVLRALIDTSLDMGVSIETNVDLLKRLALSNADLGKSQQELLKFSTRLNQVLIASGTATGEASAGVRQLGQALASGRLQGDEFRSITENIPAVASAIARGLVEMGVALRGTVGELRQLSTDGELTAERIFTAFMLGSRNAERQFDAMGRTTTRSLSTIWDSFGEGLGAIGRITGATTGWQNALAGVADAAAATAKTLLDVAAAMELAVPTTVPPADIAGRIAQFGTAFPTPAQIREFQQSQQAGQSAAAAQRRDTLGLRAVPFSGQATAPAAPIFKPLQEALDATRISAANAAESERKLAASREQTARIIPPAPMSRSEAQSFDLPIVHTSEPAVTGFASQLTELQQARQEADKINADAAAKAAAAIREVSVAYDLALDVSRQFAQNAASGLTDAAFAGKGLVQTLGDIGMALARSVTEALLFRSIMLAIGEGGSQGQAGSGLLGALFSGAAGAAGGAAGGGAGAPGRATGGRVSRGQPYLVGEAGVELFRPDTAGSIMSNRELSRFAAPASMAPKLDVKVAGPVINIATDPGMQVQEDVDVNGAISLRIRSEVSGMARRGDFRGLSSPQRGVARG